jgi:hypothetical protein
VNGVDATFTDDSPGVPAEHPELPALLNLSNATMHALQVGPSIYYRGLGGSPGANRSCAAR